MRERKEVERIMRAISEFRGLFPEVYSAQILDLTLETLLDIRDLLQKPKEDHE